MFYLFLSKQSASASIPSRALWTALQVTLIALSFVAAPTARAAFANPNPQTVDIISPKKKIDYNIDQVEAKIRLGRQANEKTLVVVLNGRDITEHFRNEDHWLPSAPVTAQLHQSDGLRAGRNTLIVHVFDENGAESFVKRPFYIRSSRGVSLGSTATIPSAVSINSSVIDISDPGSLASFSILVNGQTYYPGANNVGSCPSGTTSNYGIQVLVLNRQALEKIDYQCFDTSGSTAAFKGYLAGLSNAQQPELVVASSFLQASSPQSSEPFDTTAIGGTLYACKSGTCDSPQIYSIIGVPGLQAGQAYETSVGPTVAPGIANYPTLAGVLLQDNNEDYNFVPNFKGAFVRFKVIPGDSSGQSASVQIGDAADPTTINPPSLPSNWAGGYWLLLLHRYDLSNVVSSTLYETYASTSNQDSLAAALQAAPADNLVILTSLPSTTNNAPSVPTANLKAAIDSLGGAGYGLEPGSNLGDAYTLVSTTDTRVSRKEAIVSSSKYAAEGESGAVSGILARDHSNLYRPMTYVQDKTRADDDTSDTLRYDLYNILAQPSTPWPLPSTPGETTAHAYLSQQITVNFGCTSGSACSDYRSYYTDEDTQSNYCSTDPSSITVPANPNGFAPDDFTAMRTQLQTEKQDVCNVLDLHNNVTTLFTEENSNVALLLNNAGAEIGKVNAPTSAVVNVNQLRLTNLLLMLSKFTPIPGVPEATGLAQGFFQFGMAYANSAGVNAVPTEALNLTMAQLGSNSVSQYIALQSGTDTAFLSILQDWGKLSTVGSNIGNQVPGWAWLVSTPNNILDAFTLSTRTEFYNALLPVVYSIDGWYRLDQNDPKDLGYWSFIGGTDPVFFGCETTYTGRPDNSFVTYQNVNSSSHWDTFVITTTQYGRNPDFPSSDLVSILLGTPNQDGTGGLNLVPDLLFSANSAIPAQYAINTVGQGAVKPNSQNCGCAASQSTTTNPCSSNF